MNKEDFAQKFIELFPEKEEVLRVHLIDYGEVRGHLLFPLDFEIVNDLSKWLGLNTNIEKTKLYCNFIEKMWRYGDDEVLNILFLSILDPLSDVSIIWQGFGKHISNDFKNDINSDWRYRFNQLQSCNEEQ